MSENKGVSVLIKLGLILLAHVAFAFVVVFLPLSEDPREAVQQLQKRLIGVMALCLISVASMLIYLKFFYVAAGGWG